MDVDFERTPQGVGVARPKGALDLESGPSFKRQLIGGIDEGLSCLVVDLGGVEFIDTTGLEALASVSTRARLDKVTMYLVVKNERFEQLFRVTGLDRTMTVVAEEPDLENPTG